MKQEDTKQKILDKALELFSSRGYDAVSVGEIAQAVGIKAPSLYNHFPSKQAIFDALVESVAAQYTRDTDQISIHVQNAPQDIPVFTAITEDALYEKVRQIFEYSLHNETIRRFRRMMTIEQFRSPELSRLYTERYITRVAIMPGFSKASLRRAKSGTKIRRRWRFCMSHQSSPSLASATASPNRRPRA